MDLRGVRGGVGLLACCFGLLGVVGLFCLSKNTRVSSILYDNSPEIAPKWSPGRYVEALGGLWGPGEVSWVVLGGFSPGLVMLLGAILGAWGGPKSIKKR